MLHHGALIDMSVISSFLGDYAPLVKLFLPDITLGVVNDKDYRSIYATTCHELAHASHFTKVGTDFWNKYILYVITSYISSAGTLYGDGCGTNAGYCEVGEMWAYYMESKMHHERYGGTYTAFGNSFWFHPQILHYLEEAGIECWEIYSAMDGNVVSADALKRSLMGTHKDKAAAIELIFDRYR